MATTITIQQSVNWVQAFAGWRQLNLGTANEPAISNANLIIQTILGAPFTWNWNRATASFLTITGIQDYGVALPTFGFIEKASYRPAATITNTSLTSNVATYTASNSFSSGSLVTIVGTTNGAGVFNVTNQPIVSATASNFTVAITNANVGSASDTGTAISGKALEVSTVMNVLGTGTESGTPAFIAPQLDDNAGNITFRVLPIPDQVYQINLVFQKRIPALINSLSSTWTPIPDHYEFIYSNGFLALMMAYLQDPRWPTFNQKFVAGLLGAAEGLSEEQKNVFMTTWLAMLTDQQATGLKTTQGVQGRGQ